MVTSRSPALSSFAAVAFFTFLAEARCLVDVFFVGLAVRLELVDFLVLAFLVAMGGAPRQWPGGRANRVRVKTFDASSHRPGD